MQNVIYLNPMSGRGRAQQIYKECKDALHALFNSALLIDNLNHLHELAQRESIEKIIVVGGDGTLHHVVNTVLKVQTSKPFTLGVLSSGTGCDFSRSLNVKKNRTRYKIGAAPSLQDELARIGAGHTMPLDLGHVCLDQDVKHYYVNSASIGLGGFACGLQQGWQKKLPTMFSYLLPGVQAVLTYKGIEVRAIVHDKEQHKGLVLGVMVYNGAFSGGGMLWSPNASLNDGKLNLIWKNKFSSLKIPLAAALLLSGNIDQMPEVKSELIGEVTIESLQNKKMPVELDGEYFEASRLDFRVEAAKIRVLY